MSYQEKKSVVSILSNLLVLVAYCISAFKRFQSGLLPADDLRAWAIMMLIFIGITILVNIVIQVIFHVGVSVSVAVKKKIQNMDTNEEEIERSIGAELIEDEMDKMIRLKSSQAGPIVTGVGFLLGLISLVLSFPPAVMLNLGFIGTFAGPVVEGVVQLVYYRKGM